MKQTCEMCGGSGQLSYFKGVSRFLLSVEECPECAGLGYILPAEESGSRKDEPSPGLGKEKDDQT